MNRNTVAVFGGTGQLGSDLVEALRQDDRFDVIALRHEDADCADADAVRNALHSTKPQVVVNCAAYVRVDDCEDRPEDAFRVNAIGAFNVAKTCAELGARCVYMSTDYVFDGSKASPYTEDDTPSPINVYGASKLAGEQLVRQAAPHWLIVRMASLFGKVGARGKGGNFVETVLAKAKAGQSLTIVNDVRMSPTYTYDAARALVEVVQSDAAGVLHLTNQGSCTWYEFAAAILAETGLSVDIEPVDSHSYPMKAARPKNSALISERLDRLVSLPLRSWRSALRAYLLDKAHIPSSLRAQGTGDPGDPNAPAHRRAVREA